MVVEKLQVNQTSAKPKFSSLDEVKVGSRTGTVSAVDAAAVNPSKLEPKVHTAVALVAVSSLTGDSLVRNVFQMHTFMRRPARSVSRCFRCTLDRHFEAVVNGQDG